MEHIANIGFESYIVKDRVMAVLPVESSAVKRLKQLAAESGMVINLTFGKRTKSVIVADSGHIVFSHLSPQRLIIKLFSSK
jgi:hypothetical protein